MNYVTKSQIFSKNFTTINTITTSIGNCTKFELYVITDMRHLRCKEKGFENYPKCKIFPCGGQGQGASGRPPEPPAPECILLFFGGFPRPKTPFFPSQRYLSLLLVCLIPTIPMPRPRSGRGLLVYSTLYKKSNSSSNLLPLIQKIFTEIFLHPIDITVQLDVKLAYQPFHHEKSWRLFILILKFRGVLIKTTHPHYAHRFQLDE